MFEKKYSDEVRAVSVQRVLERRRAEPLNRSIVREVAQEFEVGEQSLRQWLARVDDGTYEYGTASTRAPRSGPDSESGRLREQVASLESEVATLREENRVLERAAAIFASRLAERSA